MPSQHMNAHLLLAQEITGRLALETHKTDTMLQGRIGMCVLMFLQAHKFSIVDFMSSRPVPLYLTDKHLHVTKYRVRMAGCISEIGRSPLSS